MSKKITFAELVKSYAEKNDLTQKQAEHFIRTLFTFITDDLQDSKKANITNFGKFELKRVAARTGINPQSGEEIIIPAHNKISFKPYKALEEHVNQEYSHLEPKIIDEQDDATTQPEASSIPTESTASKADSNDDLPDVFGISDEPDSTKQSESLEANTDNNYSKDDDIVESQQTEDDFDFPDVSTSFSQDNTEFPGDAFAKSEPASEQLDADETSDDKKDEESSKPFFTLDLPDLDDFDSLYPPQKESTESKEDESIPQEADEIDDDDKVVPIITKTEISEEHQSVENDDSEFGELDSDTNEPEFQNDLEKSDVDTEKSSDSELETTSESTNEENPVVTWLLAILILVIVGFAAWYFIFKDITPNTTQVAQSNIENNQAPQNVVAKNAESQNVTSEPIPPKSSEEAVSASQNSRPEINASSQSSATSSNNQITEKASPEKTIVPTTSSTFAGVHLVKKDEWMWVIARNVYGKSGLWPLIFQANLTVNDDPDYVVPNLSLEIPAIEGDAFNLSKNDYKRLAEATKFVSEAYANAGNSFRAAQYLRFVNKYERLSK